MFICIDCPNISNSFVIQTFKSQPLSNVWNWINLQTRHQFESILPLHPSHWIPFAEILFLFGYNNCKYSLFIPISTPQQTSHKSSSQLPPCASSQSTPDPQISSQRPNFQPFRNGDHLPTLQSNISYQPHPRVFIPIPNDRIKFERNSQPSRRTTSYKSSPVSQRSNNFQYDVVRPNNIQIIYPNESQHQFGSIQSLPNHHTTIKRSSSVRSSSLIRSSNPNVIPVRSSITRFFFHFLTFLLSIS